MSRKSILIFIFLLLFSFSNYAQKAESPKIVVDEKVGMVFFSEIFGENSAIIELRNFKGEFPSGCKTEPNTVKAKICDALKQFAKEQDIKIILDGDEIKRLREEPRIACGGDDFDKFIDVTEDFIKFYNTHIVKKND